jgi:hypothetical protein
MRFHSGIENIFPVFLMQPLTYFTIKGTETDKAIFLPGLK